MSDNVELSKKIREDVQEYYGKILQSSGDLKTNVCTFGGSAKSKTVRDILKQIHPKVLEKFYGCGIPIPECLDGAYVLDLGSGSGRDCFVLSKLVGQQGKVVGIDMTDEQVATANEYVDYHTELYGFTQPNVHFVKGYIEDLSAAGLQPDYFDIVISNCVVNLSPDKAAVLKEAYKVLKMGGEFYFSDVFVNIPLSDDLKNDEILRGECISGAFEWNEFLAAAASANFSEPRLVTCNSLEITNEELKLNLGDAKFASATYRLFKIQDKLQTSHLVEYAGSIPECETIIPMDKQMSLKTGVPSLVDQSLLTFLKLSRYQKHFKFQQTTQQLPNEVCQSPFVSSQVSISSSDGCCDASSKPANPCCKTVKASCCSQSQKSFCQLETKSECCKKETMSGCCKKEN